MQSEKSCLDFICRKKKWNKLFRGLPIDIHPPPPASHYLLNRGKSRLVLHFSNEFTTHMESFGGKVFSAFVNSCRVSQWQKANVGQPP
jgi:hypothetical protein